MEEVRSLEEVDLERLDFALKNGFRFFKSEMSRYIYADRNDTQKECHIKKCYNCNAISADDCDGYTQAVYTMADLKEISKEEFEIAWRNSPAKYIPNPTFPCLTCK